MDDMSAKYLKVMEIEHHPEVRLDLLKKYAGRHVDDFLQVREDQTSWIDYYAYLAHSEYRLYLDIVGEYVELQVYHQNKFVPVNKVPLADPDGFQKMEDYITYQYKNYGIGVPVSKWLKINILDG